VASVMCGRPTEREREERDAPRCKREEMHRRDRGIERKECNVGSKWVRFSIRVPVRGTEVETKGMQYYTAQQLAKKKKKNF
jgi:hypothetical protein